MKKPLILVIVLLVALGSAYGVYAGALRQVKEVPATITVEVVGPRCGDLNGDSLVDVLDAVIDIQIIVGVIEPTEQQRLLSDVALDGQTNVFDVILTLQHIVGSAEITECGLQTDGSISFALEELSGSGQSGTAVLTDQGNMTQVELSISAGALETELVHIHTGQCGDTLGGGVFPLTSFVGGSGSSSTLVAATLDSVMDGGHAINLHQAGSPGTYTACGNIPASSAGSIAE